MSVSHSLIFSHRQVVDDIDFCLWGSPTPNGVIGNLEAVVVAYCTKPGHGTRIIPPGTLTAVYVFPRYQYSITNGAENSQFIKTTGYIQLTGLLNQTGIGLTTDDAGVSVIISVFCLVSEPVVLGRTGPPWR